MNRQVCCSPERGILSSLAVQGRRGECLLFADRLKPSAAPAQTARLSGCDAAGAAPKEKGPGIRSLARRIPEPGSESLRGPPERRPSAGIRPARRRAGGDHQKTIEVRKKPNGMAAIRPSMPGRKNGWFTTSEPLHLPMYEPVSSQETAKAEVG